MKVTPIKSTPPPTPPPQLEKVTIELEPREALILSKVLGNFNESQIREMANGPVYYGNALMDSPATTRDADNMIALYFQLNALFPQKGK